MHDVAVIGAGPAGCAAAIAAARAGARVVLLDKAQFPRDKACGDGIAPQALAVLRELGVSDVEEGFAPIERLSITGPSGARAEARLREPVRVIPREVFDARLVEAAVAAGAELRHHHMRQMEIRPDRVILDGTIEARVLIGADGASSAVRRRLGYPLNPPGHVAIAIRGYAPQPEGELCQQIIMSEQDWPAYAWSFPIGDGRRNVGYGQMLRGEAVSRAHLLHRLGQLVPGLKPGATTALRAHHLPLSTRRPAAGRGRVLIAGDALSLINPFTGEGIFYAVVSGALAGAAAARGGSAAAAGYAAALRHRLHRHLRHTSLVARLSSYPRLIESGIRAAARDERVFHSLVELGLGDGLLTLPVLGAVARSLAGGRR